MVAEQEVNDLLCGDVSVAIQAKRRRTTFTAGRSRDIAGTKVVQGEAVPVGNGLGFAHAFANVLDCGVAIEDRLPVDVGPPSEQDRFGVMIEPRSLRAGEKLRSPHPPFPRLRSAISLLHLHPSTSSTSESQRLNVLNAQSISTSSMSSIFHPLH